MNDYCVFIVTNGRPERQITYKTLRMQNYTGKVFFIIDDQDKTATRYKEIYGDSVIIFDKETVAAGVDVGDNRRDLRTVLIARNACHDIAVSLGFKYYIVMDDDYTRFSWIFNYRQEFIPRRPKIKSLNKAFEIMFDFYITSGLSSLAMFQGGDMIGGAGNKNAKTIYCHRKCMQTFFCSTDRKINWVSRLNDDVSTYIATQQRGDTRMMSVNLIQVDQGVTQRHAGGMTEEYLDSGTYVKSFYSVMFAPSAVKVGLMGSINKRLHHQTKWSAVAPLYIAEKYKKAKLASNES
jgi:hypothetical protein